MLWYDRAMSFGMPNWIQCGIAHLVAHLVLICPSQGMIVTCGVTLVTGWQGALCVGGWCVTVLLHCSQEPSWPVASSTQG